MRRTVVALLEERSGVIMTYFELLKEGYKAFQSLMIYINQHANDTIFYSGQYTLGFTCLAYAFRMFRSMINVQF